jgi:cellulose synthase operon protein C
MRLNKFAFGTLCLGAAALLTACGGESAEQLVARGQAELAAKDARSAIIRFKAALQANPDAVATRVLLGRALLEGGEPAGAALELTKALEAKAKPEDVVPTLAQAMLQSGQVQRLVDLYGNTNLDVPLAQADLQAVLVAAWTVLGQEKKAAAALDKGKAAAPDSARILVQQARLELLRGTPEKALETAKSILSRDSKLAEAWHLQALAESALNKDKAAVEASLRQAIAQDGAYEPAWSSLVALKINQKEPAAAKTELEKFQKAVPGSLNALFLESQIAFFEGNFTKARDGTQQLLKHAPRNTNLLQLSAAVEWKAGSLVVAERRLALALQIDPSLSEARVNIAHIRLRLGQQSRAMEALQPLLASSTPPAAALAAAGEVALASGRAEQAEKYFQAANKITPEDAKVGTALAVSRLARGDANSGFTLLESIATSSADGAAAAALVSARLARKEFDLALSSLDKLLEKHPKNASLHELRGRILIHRGDLAGARVSLDKAVAMDGRYLAAIARLADIDVREGKPGDGVKRFQTLLAAEPQNHHAWIWLAELQQTARLGEEAVRESLQSALKAAPDEPGPRVRLINHLAAQKKLKDALSLAQESVAALPNDLTLLDALGRVQMASGSAEQALATFKRITNADPDFALAHTRIADIHRAAGDTSASIASLRRALQADPNMKSVRIELIDALVGSKRSKEALELAADVQKRDPQLAAGYLLEGGIHRKMKNLAPALQAYQKGMGRATDTEELAVNVFAAHMALGDTKAAESFALDRLRKQPNDGAMHFNLSDLYISRSEWPAAERHLRLALEQRPDFPVALNNLASVLTQQGKPGGVPLAERAVYLQPNQPAMLDTLATALLAANEPAKALEVQKKAVEIAPSEPMLRLNLAKAAIRAGDKALAKAELDKLASNSSRPGVKAQAATLLKTL